MFGLTEKQMTILTVAAICLTAIAGGVVIYYFQFDVLAEKKKTLATVETSIEAEQKKVPDIETFNREIKDLQQKIKGIEGTIPALSIEEYDKFINTMEELRRQSGVTIASARFSLTGRSAPLSPSLPGRISRVEYSMAVTGSFYHLLKFLNVIETQSRFIHVVRFSINPLAAKEGSDACTMPLVISTYIFNKPFTPAAASTPAVEMPWLQETTPIQ